MKNIINKLKYTSIIIFVLIIGCSEDLIDIPPMAQLTSEAFEPESAVIGCYNALSANRDKYSNWKFIIMPDLVADDAWKGGESELDQPDFLEMMNFFTVSTNEILFDLWWRYYQAIYIFNSTIEGIENYDMDAAVKNRLLGEVKFLRAHHYLKLNALFGGVPLVTEPLSPEEMNISRSTAEQVYAQIEVDLIDAIEHLPKKAIVDGRVTWGAAKALLARTYLYQSKWADAEKEAKDIIDEGIYSLTPDFKDIWGEAGEYNSESIFEIAYANNVEGSSRATWVQAQWPRKPTGGWGLNNPTKDLLDEFQQDPNDPRIIWTFVFSGDISESVEFDFTAWQCIDLMQSRKVWVPVSEKWPSKYKVSTNVRVIRYADVLLMYAEAANENNHSAEAIAALNQVRKRASNSNVNDEAREYVNIGLHGYSFDFDPALQNRVPDVISTGKDDLINAIRHERRTELAMEGHRWFDLVRWGIAGQTMRSFADKYNTSKGLGFVDGKNEVFPIPQNEIDKTNPPLEQNSGY